MTKEYQMEKTEVQMPDIMSEESGMSKDTLPPLPDFSALADKGEDAIGAVTRSYAEEINSYVEQQLESRVAHYKEKAEVAAVKEQMAKSSEYVGFTDNLDRIEALIEKMKSLKSLPADERYTLAYLIDRGQSIKGKSELSGACLVDALFADDEALRIFESRRLAKQQRQEKLPPFSAAEGAAGMPANVIKKPETIDQAGKAARKYFGL